MNEIKLPSIFSKSSVLQANKPINIWGMVPGNTQVAIELSGADFAEKSTTLSMPDGYFFATLPPCGYKSDLTLTISAADATISIPDISIGEVWFACGQSNMEFRLKYDKDWEKIKAYEKDPRIHMFNVPQLAFKGHKKNTDGFGLWLYEGDEGYELFSAPGYSFARNLTDDLDCHVGIISCNWGGSTATAWLPAEDLENCPLDVYLKEYESAVSLYCEEEMKRISLQAWALEDSADHGQDFEPLLYGQDRKWQLDFMKRHEGDPVIPLGPYSINRPGGLYHEMLEPIMNYAAQGVIWYQGETDAGKPDIYDLLMEKVINNFRKYQGDEMPFLFVQLAPFGVWLACGANGYTEMRHTQEKVTAQVPYTGMASIMDIGCYYDIHPKNKQEVGRRLSLLARSIAYKEDILCQSPKAVSATADYDAKTVSVSFNNVLSQGLHSDGKRSDFAVMQFDGNRTIDDISLEDNKVILQLSDLTEGSIHIELAWADYAEVHIFNEAGLPLLPFTMDI